MTLDEQTLTRGERTRQVILGAARRLFLANGYHGTSMRQIARAAHVALGGIYNHFDSKEDIFKAVLEEQNPYWKAVEALDGIEGSSGPEMLAEAFGRLLTFARENVDYFALALTDVREFEGRTIRVLAASVIPGILRFAERVEAAGGLRRDVDHLILMRLFVSLLIGYMFTDLIAYSDEQPLLPGMPSSQQARAGVQDILLHGVAAREDGT